MQLFSTISGVVSCSFKRLNKAGDSSNKDWLLLKYYIFFKIIVPFKGKINAI